MNYLTSNKSIATAIVGIATAGQAWRSEVHRVGCSILRKWNKDGHMQHAIANLNALREALGTAVRVNAFVDWVLATGSVGWSTEDKCFVSNKNTITSDAVRSAIDTPFWDYRKSETVYKPITNWVEFMRQACNRARKDIEQLGDKSVVNVKELQAIEKLVAEV